ncbi:ankyrin repeat-containing domain protein [Lyophyllum atratum]|nr:ankyrin repeat-containing domain protein [Lyophyllum atratum]
MAQVDTPTTPKVSDLPHDTIDFAHRMFEAARTGNSVLLLAAIDAGLPVNLTNDKGNTLLMLAAYAGHAELTKELLKRGADPNRLNDLGQSPIAGAVFKGHDEVVRALAEKGADPRLGTPNAIQAAHMFGRKELMEVLGTKEGDIGSEVPTPPSALPA